MAKQTITVIKGDGIGPSIIDSALEILKAAGCDFDYEFVDAGLAALEKTGELLDLGTYRFQFPLITGIHLKKVVPEPVAEYISGQCQSSGRLPCSRWSSEH